MDGVLVDSREVYFKLVAKVFRERGLKYDQNHFLANFGKTTQVVMKILLGAENAHLSDEMADEIDSSVALMVRGNVYLLPGVKKWLKTFRDAGVRQAVASSATMNNIEAIICEVGIQDYFDEFISASELESKPSPAVFLEGARRFNAPPDECLVIEDSPAGLTAARAAGIRSLAVQTSYPLEMLEEASMVVENLDRFTQEDLRRLMKTGGDGR
jgi:HAD superfamily hydrolase (TIGR01509 family)